MGFHVNQILLTCMYACQPRYKRSTIWPRYPSVDERKVRLCTGPLHFTQVRTAFKSYFAKSVCKGHLWAWHGHQPPYTKCWCKHCDNHVESFIQVAFCYILTKLKNRLLWPLYMVIVINIVYVIEGSRQGNGKYHIRFQYSFIPSVWLGQVEPPIEIYCKYTWARLHFARAIHQRKE